ncbi:MAG: hypothetical protein LBE03_01370 [Candidatus Nomurabacteria bacterium]|jgi:alpha-tubulin suppressor-like RCC1 family protein|nr:hypothetical protein [Candidatus Nomurabacteria bacterium]
MTLVVSTYSSQQLYVSNIDAYATQDISISETTGPTVGGTEVEIDCGGCSLAVKITKTAAGWTHALALDDMGTVYAWGSNSYGELGIGNATTDDVAAPVKVDGLDKIVAIAAGGEHSMAINEAGELYIWGNNSYGQIGNGTTVNVSSPIKLNGLGGASNAISADTKIVAIAARGYHSLAVDENGKLYAWGRNDTGQVGNGTSISNVLRPIKINGLQDNTPNAITNNTRIVAVAAGRFHSLAVDDSGLVYAWGKNTDGQIGNGNKSNDNVLAPIVINGYGGESNAIKASTKIVTISAGLYFSIVSDIEGNVYTWGKNDYGQLGDGSTTDTTTPKLLARLSNITKLAGGGRHVLAVSNDGEVYTWGQNNYGQIGNEATATNGVSTPQLITTLEDITAIAGGGESSYAVNNDGELFSWGHDNRDQTGNGAVKNTNVTSPLLINNLEAGVPNAISGSNRTLEVWFDDTLAEAACVDGVVFATTPPHVQGKVDITIKIGNDTVVLAEGFEYIDDEEEEGGGVDDGGGNEGIDEENEENEGADDEDAISDDDINSDDGATIPDDIIGVPNTGLAPLSALKSK